MTSSRFRRQRPVLDGDFPDDDTAVTEILQQIQPAGDWDGTTLTFGGASDAGLPPGDAYPGADPATGPRQATDMTAMPGRGTGPHPRPRAAPPAGRAGDDTIARDMARAWPHLFEVRCAYPAAASTTPIPCDSIHRDPAARSFRALRTSAWAAGWHLDAFGRLACPHCCQASPEYRTLYPLVHWNPHAPDARLAGAHDAEFALRAITEHDLIRDVLDTARHGRHAGGAR